MAGGISTFFFFSSRRRHTRSRCDWSSDVCSSDLIDEAGINDDRDMLQEMRMVLRAHRVPGMDDDVPTTSQVFRMATSGGAKTTAFGDRLGVLEVGRAADMVLIDWQHVSYPYLDTETPVLDAVLQRAKSSGVSGVICDGEVIYADGHFTKVDREAAL